MRLPFSVSIDALSFFFGFVIASIFWWVVGRARPLWNEINLNLKKQREESSILRMSNVEEIHRRVTLRRAQGMHLAAPLFALNEILQEPRVLAPLPRVEPGGLIAAEDAVTETLPYMPSWPELAAVYKAPTFNLAQALSGGANLVVIGQPGSGKTVAIANLASLAANRSEELGSLKDAIPFLIHVAELKLPIHEKKDLLDRFIEMTSEHASMLDFGKVAGFVQNSFLSGRALLLLDGFDELTTDGEQEVSDYLKILLEEYPKIRIVTTGTPEYLDGLFSLRFIPVAIAAWTKQKEIGFIRNWGQLWSQFISVEGWAQTGPAQVDPLLLNNWLGSDNQKLTPLELTLKVWGAYAGDSFGPHILEAIAAHIRRLAPNNTPLAALESLAMQVTLTSQPIFDPRKARAWVKAFELPEEADSIMTEGETEAEDLKNEIKNKGRKKSRNAPSPTPGLLGRLAATGLVVSHPNNKMRFIHPVIGGYLAGRALSAFKAEETLLNQSDWTGKLLAMRYLAAYGDVNSLVSKMLEWSRLPMHRPLLTAARWLRDAPREAPWRGKVLAALAELLQTEGLALSLRGQALAAFAASDDPGVPTLFRQFMNTLSFELMKLVALGSGALHDGKATPILIGMLEAPSISARQAACLALIAIGSPDALEAVAKTLLNGDENLRKAAAEALANDPKEGYDMLKDGVTMKDILLRRAIVYGLKRVNEPWSNDLLQKMLVEDDQWVVRNSASEVLETQNLANDPRLPRPIKTPSETSWLIEFAGTQGVGISPGAPATDILLAALKGGKVEERLGALPYLKQIPSDGVIKQIYSAMYADDPELREAAYMTLWEVGASGYKLPHPTQFGFS